MKYLADDKLTQITTELTDAVLGEQQGGGMNNRVINGRIEAFIMTRTGADKKYAHALGEKYVTEMETLDKEVQTLMHKTTTTPKTKKEKKRKQRSISIDVVPPSSLQKPPPRKNRATSFDQSEYLLEKWKQKHHIQLRLHNRVSSSSSNNSNGKEGSSPNATAHFPSPLGDFCEMSTRRLMTNLILTLNASFPDYDFSEVRPSHFVKLPSARSAIRQVNERLSELASYRDEGFLTRLWTSIDQAIGVLQQGNGNGNGNNNNSNKTEVYSYVPPTLNVEDDPLSFLPQTLVVSDNNTTNDPSSTGMNTSSMNDGVGAVGTASSSSSSSPVVPLWTFNYFFVNKALKRIVVFSCVETVQHHYNSDEFLEDGEEEDYFSENRSNKNQIWQYSRHTSKSAASSSSVDFDWDPAADVAGGIPVTTA